MEDIAELLKGDDYVKKLDQFTRKVNEIENKIITSTLVYVGILMLRLGAVLTYKRKKAFIKKISQDVWKNERYPTIFIPYKT